MRRAAKVDANQAAIVAALRAVGASVQPIHMVGRGVPDLVVGYRGNTYLLEVKTEDGKLTTDEGLWIRAWNGQIAIVRTAEEAIDVIRPGRYRDWRP